MKAILGEKLGMTQLFKGDTVIPVTVLRAGPCVVTQLKVKESDGYEAVQVGFGEMREEHLNSPMRGHLKKSGASPRYLAELPLDPSQYRTGQKIGVDIFEEGDRADVTGISKGKGFAGVIKRHGFHGGPASHGANFHRAPGAIGQCASPSRVFKGKKLPGRMGGEKVTALNLQVVGVDASRNLLLLKGSVPGPRGALVVVKEAARQRNKRKR